MNHIGDWNPNYRIEHIQSTLNPTDLNTYQGEAHVNLRTGKTSQEKAVTRSIIHEMNFLHLNHPKKLWTWFADLYALALAFLSITGLFVLRGKKGISGRGAWLTGAGIMIPVCFLVLYL